MGQQQDTQYLLMAVLDKDTDKILKYSIIKDTPSAHGPDHFNPKVQSSKIIGTYATRNAAVVVWRRLSDRLKLDTKTNLTKSAIELPEFDSRLPSEPAARSAFFQALSRSEQEDLLYELIVRTGRPPKMIAQYLHLTEQDLEAFDSKLFLAAKAELELRLAQALVMWAVASKGKEAFPSAQFLTKVLMGWEDATAEAPKLANPEVVLNVVRNDTPETQALRSELNALVAEADAQAARTLQ